MLLEQFGTDRPLSAEFGHSAGHAVVPVAYSRKDAALALGVSVWTVDELIASGEIEARRHGRRILVSAASMIEWFESLPEA